MPLHNIFDTDPLDTGAGYTADASNGPAILVGGYYVTGGATDYELRGGRIYLSSGPSYAGAYMYVWSLSPKTLVYVAPVTLTAGWNDVDMSAVYAIEEFPGGRYFAVGFYLPHGGHVVKTSAWSNGSAVHSSTDTRITIAEDGDFQGDTTLGFPGNNSIAVLFGPLDDPTDPSPAVFTRPGVLGTGTHFGVDVIVADPSEAPGVTPVGPAFTADPVITTDGTPQSGETVSCTTGTATGSPLPTFTRQWTRAGSPIGGATGLTYTLTDLDVAAAVACTVTATNSEGSDVATTAEITPAEAAPTTTSGRARFRTNLDSAAWSDLKVASDAHNRFYPEDFGAKADGETDCQGAINSCIAAAVTAAREDGSYYYEILFGGGVYLLDSPTIKGGTTLGNAQIPLPAILPEDEQKLVGKLLGSGKASALHWAQRQPLRIGTVLKSTLTGQSSDGTYGAPSIIGTPTVEVGDNGLAPDFSNLHVVMDGITVMAPPNPTLVGVDLRGAAQASILDLTTITDAVVGEIVAGSNGLGVGLMMPSAGNNAVCDIGAYTCEGWNCALTIAEHVVAQRILAVYCGLAVFVAPRLRGNATNHASTIQYLCAEVVDTVIAAAEDTDIAFALNIDTLDTEIVDSGTHVVDVSNILRGVIRWHDYQATAPRISGAENLHVYDLANNTHYGPAWTEG